MVLCSACGLQPPAPGGSICRECAAILSEALRLPEPSRPDQFPRYSSRDPNLEKMSRDLCHLCGVTVEDTPPKRLVVDHNHQNGKVRGFLCYSCNSRLRFVEKNTAWYTRAIEYLGTKDMR